MKKIIICIIIALQLFSVTGPAAGAAGKKVPEAFVSAMEELSALALLQGDENGNLHPEAFITRAEFATLLTRVLKLSDRSGVAGFTDVPQDHWAGGAIGAVNGASIMSGYPDGSFQPEGMILFEEAAKTLVQLLGYAEQAAAYGGYPWGDLLAAAELGITTQSEGVAGEKLTRGMLARILLNALYITPHVDAGVKTPLISIACPEVFFVSPEGTDSGDGSYLHPWASLKRAAEALRPGQTAIFEDGVYKETAAAELSGGDKASITLRARNPRGASIIFPEVEGAGLSISADCGGLLLKHFDFSQNTGTLIQSEASDAVFSGNHFGGQVLIESAKNVQITDNLFEGAGLSAGGTEALVVRGNTFTDAGDWGLCIDGGSFDARISNNTIIVSEPKASAGILLDGASHCALWSNVVAVVEAGEIDSGLLLRGASRCSVFNNVVSGATAGVTFGSGTSGEQAGFAGADITLRNNIISETLGGAYVFHSRPEGFDADYNLFYEAYPEHQETHSLFGYPEFVDKAGDWRVISKSPAAYSAAAVPEQLLGKNGTGYALDMTDMNGEPAGERLSMGAYRSVARTAEQVDSGGNVDSLRRFQPSGTVLISEDFHSTDLLLWIPKAGDWLVEGGALRQILPSAGRSFMVYTEGYNWTDVAISADVKSPPGDSSNVGIAFRQSADTKNAYVFRILAKKSLQLGKWVNGSFQAINHWEYPFEYDTVYNLGVEARGTRLTLYVNGEKIAEVEDSSHAVGTVSMYSYVQESMFDNLLVTVPK